MIEDCLSEYLVSYPDEDVAPVIVWVDNRSGESSDPGPTLAIRAVSGADGLESVAIKEGILLYNALPPDQARKHETSSLDFDRQFEFVD